MLYPFYKSITGWKKLSLCVCYVLAAGYVGLSVLFLTKDKSTSPQLLDERARAQWDHSLGYSNDPLMQNGPDSFQPNSFALEEGISFMSCHHQIQSSCIVHNLYYINKEFHAFIPSLSTRVRTIQVYTGIGYQTPNITITIHNYFPPTHIRKLPRIKKVASIFSVMWENLFRTMYAGCGAWYTMMFHKVFQRDHHIILNDAENSNRFLTLFKYVNNNPIIYLSLLKDVRLDVAVIGIAKEFRIKEIEVERGDDPSYELRGVALRGFAHTIRSSVLSQLTEETGLEKESQKWTVGWIKRNGKTRNILNEQELLDKMAERTSIDLQIFNFDGLPLAEQIRSAYNVDVLVGMHGAGLAHIFFMRPSSIVMELTPYGFQKRIYQNLAKVMGVKYVYWRNTIRNNTVFDWSHVEMNRLTNRKKEDIINRPVDWYNMDSKNYWRNQDTTVDLPSFMTLFDVVINYRSKGFLFAMPWEQLNNQLIEFKSSCAVSSILNRVLVLPYVGYRKEFKSNKWDFSFQILDYQWDPIEDYFDESYLARLPCQTISMSNFKSLMEEKETTHLGMLHFNPVAHATSQQQLIDYYVKVLNFTYDMIISENRMYQLTEEEIKTQFGSDRSKWLVFGCMFWFYNFEKYQDYPLQSYANYMDHFLYRQMVDNIRIHSGLTEIAEKAATGKLHGRFLAVHVRRGDYWNKCRRISDKVLQAKCYPSVEALLELISIKANDYNIRNVYIATNLDGDHNEFEPLKRFFKLFYYQDVFPNTAKLNSNQKALLDVAFCSLATDFVGNFYSSFSRSIFEQRELMGLPFSTF